MSGEGDRVALAQLSEKLKTIISHLYDLELTASDYPADAPPDLLHEQIRRLVGDYSALESMKSESGINIPQDVVEYVEAGRNPNVYTRQFSEAVTKESQGMHGKMTAHEDFATVLGSLVEQEFPELRDQVAMAMQEEVQPQEIKE